MKRPIWILCSDKNHPIWPTLECFCQQHNFSLLSCLSENIRRGYLFLVSCSKLITPLQRSRFENVLVLHASDLPEGRGWSPHIWSVLNGKSEITVSLLEAADPVDTGTIWLKKSFSLAGTELYNEINDLLFTTELFLIKEFVTKRDKLKPTSQKSILKTASYYDKRSPEMSELNIHNNIADQFDLLRVCDYDRYPAFFKIRGQKYKIKIEKM